MTKLEEQEQYYDHLLESMSTLNESQLVEALSRMNEAQIAGVLKSQIRQVSRFTKKAKKDYARVETAAGKNVQSLSDTMKRSMNKTKKLLKDLEDTKTIQKMTDIMLKAKKDKLENLDGADKASLKADLKNTVKSAKEEENK
jgi:hypothetical protein